MRNTKVIDIVRALGEYRLSVTVYDPWANPEAVRREYGIDVVNELHEGRRYDAVIAAVAHAAFADLDLRPLLKDSAVVFDVKDTRPRAEVDDRL